MCQHDVSMTEPQTMIRHLNLPCMTNSNVGLLSLSQSWKGLVFADMQWNSMRTEKPEGKWVPPVLSSCLASPLNRRRLPQIPPPPAPARWATDWPAHHVEQFWLFSPKARCPARRMLVNAREWRNNASWSGVAYTTSGSKARSNARSRGRSLAFKTRRRMCFSYKSFTFICFHANFSSFSFVDRQNTYSCKSDLFAN